ncbi:peptide chain release factor N(5)-glutamine methyltransferase [Sphingobium sp. AN641]|uniref:peptide chain release factor N(5)-glutamine methyltransferase n=1 Tax=Sphingobium sp. AN641 TaxID=3133443 RepID=UPI0030BC2934
MSIAAALGHAAARLATTSDTARLDAELLMAHALGTDRADMLLRQRDLTVPDGFAALVERRMSGEPVAYIIGSRDFWTLTLHVTPAVLIPRPDSETLIEAAVDHFRARPPQTILDLGTGSGALLLAALDQWRDARGLGIDVSPDALTIAAGNAARLGMMGRAAFLPGDWGEGLAEPFDLILVNPPYIAIQAQLPRDVRDHEPHGALFAGTDGLDDYRRIAPQLSPLLAAGGMAAIEIGFDQRDPVSALLRRAGMNVAVRQDLAGHDRCLIATPG